MVVFSLNWWNSSASEDSATPNEFPYCCIWKKPSITPCSRGLTDFTFISMGLVSQLGWEKNSLSAPAASMHHGVPGTHRPLSYKILQVEASPFFPKPASISVPQSVMFRALVETQDFLLKPTPFIHLFSGVFLRKSFLLLFDDHKDNNKLSTKQSSVCSLPFKFVYVCRHAYMNK